MKYLVLFLVFILTVSSLSAQEKEWKQLTGLLQAEAQYFTGKNGFIQFGKSEYNTFTIEKFSVTDSLVNFKMKLQDRFGNEETAQQLEETIVLHPDMKIHSATIDYNYAFYFENFPNEFFLLLEFEEAYPMIHQIINTFKDVKTKEEDRSQMEETTYQVYFPIRSKNREKIFKAIENYQLQTIKKELENDQNH
ncbi:hypothetical protein SAMN02927921_02139 [Sinomicrobium oceani]|uniref:DUF4468 domain-containing protein n=1 Tax=Sinomicrobium oceani TaxID=1150368 RepID=A0A1K1PYP6_9FLAO|nr:hypothetical protein [Sinomicrobium oceani]SFW52571.1 hypothetical protein SAMN02927921_02139 [Sinomicrobium oceani]